MYKLSAYGGFIRTADGACIPDDANNPDFQACQSWIAQGNVPAPGSPQPRTPLQEILDIEAVNPVTHRMLRELTLSVAQIASAVTGRAPEENPAVRDIQAIEAQIAALRLQAKEQGLIP
jgi:hypothetical protein